MKKILLLLLAFMITGGITMGKELNQPFAEGELNPYNKFFTGTTHLQRLVEKDDIWNSSIANVTFDKGARTNWHKHSGGQILLVTAGEGRYQEKGKEIQILKTGDVVKIPPEVEHWHGAAPDCEFAHISIESKVFYDKKNTDIIFSITDFAKFYFGCSKK